MKNFITKQNVYYAAAAVCMMIAIYFMGTVYADNRQESLQANLILSDVDGVVKEIKTQSSQIEKTIQAYQSNLPENIENLKKTNFRLNDLTRYFDSIEQQYRQSGIFEVSTLNYTSIGQGADFVEVNLSLVADRTNLLDFLSFIERTGFTEDETEYLMEVRNISFSVPDLNELEGQIENLTYQVTLGLRIYKF